VDSLCRFTGRARLSKSGSKIVEMVCNNIYNILLISINCIITIITLMPLPESDERNNRVHKMSSH
jgi:hypothetical protein